MVADPDPDPDPNPNPDRDVAAAFRGVAGSGGRLPLVVLVIAAVAVLGFGLLARESDPNQTTPAPSEARADPTTRAPEPSAGLTAAGPPSHNPAASPVALPDLTAVEAGPIHLIPAGAPDIRIAADLPATGVTWYRVHDGWYLGGEEGPETFISIGAWQVEHVFVYPCRWSGRHFADAELMQSSDGVSRALSTWWGQDPTLLPYNNSDLAPLATLPREVRFRGRDAHYLEVLMPSRMSFSACDGSQVLLWEAADGTPRPAIVAGELNRLWVLGPDSADEQLLVIDISTYVTPSDETVATMEALIASISIGPPESPAGSPDPAATP